MKTIVIHHIQYIWDSGLRSLNTSFQEQLEKVYEHLSENYYDKVIVTNFEANQYLDDEQSILSEFHPEVHDYMYGWDQEQKDSSPEIEWAEGGNHSEYVIIDEWMKELEGEVYLCGAFDGECIEDIEIALDYVGVNLKRIEELIS